MTCLTNSIARLADPRSRSIVSVTTVIRARIDFVIDHGRQDLSQAAGRIACGTDREPLLAGIVALLEFDVADVDDKIPTRWPLPKNVPRARTAQIAPSIKAT